MSFQGSADLLELAKEYSIHFLGVAGVGAYSQCSGLTLKSELMDHIWFLGWNSGQRPHKSTVTTVPFGKS